MNTSLMVMESLREGKRRIEYIWRNRLVLSLPFSFSGVKGLGAGLSTQILGMTLLIAGLD